MTLSVREAAELIGISRPKMNELIHSHEIPSIHIGKKITISRKALMDWLSEGETNGKKNVLTAKETSESGPTEAGRPDTAPMGNGIRSTAELRQKSGRS